MSRDSVSTRTAPAALRLNWDVFLSFRGQDTRKSITTSLYNSLNGQGIRVFVDDVGMREGDEIAPSLFEAIDDSAIYVIILSQNYASSHWCLEELARITQLKGRLILPVFFWVDPSHVRRQKGPFEQHFGTHLERFGQEKVDIWRKAMSRVGGLSGLVFVESNTGEKQLIKRLADRILEELRRTPEGIATYTVGLDSRVEELLRLLDNNRKRVTVLGLHGIGGIGKTTLAKALYNKLIARFEYRCFISNVRENCKDDSLVSLQNKLLRDLFSNYGPTVSEIGAGITRIRNMVHQGPVLIVLDDVDDVYQLNALVGKREWFIEGSLIIITTRNKDALVEHIVNELYEVRELYFSEALQLFSYHALRREKPTDEYLSLSKAIVSLTGQLPLALEVFGSFLFDKRRIKDWEDALNKLKCIRPADLQNVLRISFDGLDEEEKCVFLDIACFFVKIGLNREEAIDVLKGCGFNAETAIVSLMAKSLIKISEDNSLWMHDQLRDMGRQIVREEHIQDPGMRSRLWEHDEIMTVLKYNKGTRNIQGIILDFSKKPVWENSSTKVSRWDALQRSRNFVSALLYLVEKFKTCLPVVAQVKEEEAVLSTKPFERMINLRLLQINHAKLEGKFRSFPAEVKWLQWKGCPLKSLPGDYSPGKLSVLDLSKSGIVQVWGQGISMMAENLMVMNLRHCYNLVAVPDISRCKALEKLVLENCTKLTEIHKSVGHSRKLVHLNLERCSNLVKFSQDIRGLKSLQSLILSECSSLKELPVGIGSLKSLKELFLGGTAISILPDSFYGLTQLEKLVLDRCQLLKHLPVTCFQNLISLKELSLNGSALEQLPDSVGSLSNLEKLGLMWCRSLTALPESVGNLQSLREVSFNGSEIRELPASIGSLPYLENLTAGGCRSLSKLPVTIGGLASITKLELDNTSITELPDQISDLKMIQALYVRNCLHLRSFPDAVGKMSSLTTINFFGSKITELPESLGMLENLIVLKLNECRNLCKLPDSFGNLKSLLRLLMKNTAVTELPESFGKLSSLMILQMGKKPEKSFNSYGVLPTSFSDLYSLETFNARAWRISGNINDDFLKLSMLEFLDLGYNNFHSLPSSLMGLSLLKKLLLPHCKWLRSLPPLPSSLDEVDVANCFELETISDVSKLESLESLNVTNCEKLMDIPGLECLKSLRRLYMSGCRACSLAVKRRLSKVCLRNIHNLSMPGSEIPDWFSPEAVLSSERRNEDVKAIIICVVISVGNQVPEELRDELPVLPNIRAQILNRNRFVHGTTLNLVGVPRTEEEQLHLCRFPTCHPLVSSLREGYRIEVSINDIPFLQGVALKRSGIHLVFEDDDDFGGNEEILDHSQLSVSEKLSRFYTQS